MRINSLTSPLFQKKLVATCSVLKNNRPEQCCIYQLDKEKDKNYFKKLSRKNGWKKAHYLAGANKQIKNEKDTVFYVMEDVKEKCLGYCIMSNSNGKYGHDLLYLEVKPACTNKNGERKIKYVGETLITFLTDVLKRDNKNSLSVSSMANRARNFYLQKCGFRQNKEYRSAIIELDGFKELEQKNIMHTGSKIDFME